MSQTLIFLSLITLLVPILPSSTAETQLIITTCKKATGKNYESYVNLLQSDPKSVTATLEGLGQISIEQLRKRYIATYQQVKGLSKSSKFDTWVKDGLASCAGMYSTAESELADALTAFKKGDYDTVNSLVDGASDFPGTCEGGFFERKGETSPITKVNNEMDSLGEIAVDLTSLFH